MDNRKWAADALATAPVAPAAPSNGYPTNGDPGSGQNATEPGAWWFHAIGEEIRAVIEAGGLSPNLGNLTQLRDAILTMIGAGSQSLLPNGYRQFEGGLLLQWGSITLPVSVSTANVDVTYPVAFPNAAFLMIGSIGVHVANYDASASYRSNTQSVSYGIPSTTGCEGQAFIDNSLLDNRIVKWLAIGY